jgi:hypothetical protein
MCDAVRPFLPRPRQTRPASRPRCLTMARRCLAHNFQAVWYGAAIRALCWPATPPEVKFAAASLPEEARFEPLVPPRRPVSSCCRSRSRRLFGWRECNRQIRSRKFASRGDRWFKSGFLQRPSVANPAGNPASGPLAFRDHVWGARPRMQPKKLQTVRPVDPPPGRQWKLLKINVSESMLSPSLPISLHAGRSPSADGPVR